MVSGLTVKILASMVMMRSVSDEIRIIWSCGGGMPPDASTENLRTFITTVRNYSKKMTLCYYWVLTSAARR